MTLAGRYVRLAPLGPGHAAALHAANAADEAIWDSSGMARSAPGRLRGLGGRGRPDAPTLFLCDHPRGRPTPLGVAALMRVDIANGVVEVGHICLGAGPAAQPRRDRGDPPARRLGLRGRLPAVRVEVRRRQRPEPPCRRSLRLRLRGHIPPAHDRQGPKPRHRLVRDADHEWPDLSAAHHRWLDPANFDAEGLQRAKLGDLTAPVRERAEAAVARLGR